MTPESLQPPVEPMLAGAPARPQRYGWLALLLVGPILLVIVKIFPTLDGIVYHNALGHLLITGAASLIGVALALLVLHVAYRAQDGRVFLVGMGFLTSASIFITHSIATPDVLMSGRGAIGVMSAFLSLLSGSVFFALSGLNLSDAASSWLIRRAGRLLLVYLGIWIAYNLIFLIFLPAPSLPLPPLLLSIIYSGLVAGGLVGYIFAAQRHYMLYRRSPSKAGLVILCGVILFAEALFTRQLSVFYSTSFWIYHVEEFIGFGVIAYAVLGAYRRGQADESFLESLFLAGTRTRIWHEQSQAMDALVASLSSGERPTAALRQMLRERFGLAESQIQLLEQAAMTIAQERRQRHELERLNATLRQLEHDKDQLTQMVIHDLKNPLSALVGFLEMLWMDNLTDDQRSLVESGLRSGKNLSGLIGDLLDIGRLEEGRLELDRSVFAAHDLINDCADELRAWLTQEEKTILIDAPTNLPLIHADLRLIRRVILNLLSNAIKHTTASTRITLRAYCERADSSNEYVIIEVEDNGPGIPADHLDHIFEKFTRFGDNNLTRQQSTGLGLTFCRLAIEAHGTAISVSSTPSVGTTFRVALPTI